MLVTLSSPPGAQLRGVVSGIEPGKSLTLRNGTLPSDQLALVRASLILFFLQ
jgi:enhancer of mRNA-decapping protein 3